MRDGYQQITRAPHILLYSHDTFGLGHLRRSRAIAEALVSAIAGSSALILTGSPVAGPFHLSRRASITSACPASSRPGKAPMSRNP